MVELIRSVGASAEWCERNTLSIHAREIRAADLDPELCGRIRASILLAGPLLARCGEVALPPPGGDVIGRRRLDTHFLAFQQLGATVTATHRLEFRATRLTGADVFLDEPSGRSFREWNIPRTKESSPSKVEIRKNALIEGHRDPFCVQSHFCSISHSRHHCKVLGRGIGQGVVVTGSNVTRLLRVELARPTLPAQNRGFVEWPDLPPTSRKQRSVTRRVCYRGSPFHTPVQR
jgi:hypothetical protein